MIVRLVEVRSNILKLIKIAQMRVQFSIGVEWALYRIARYKNSIYN